MIELLGSFGISAMAQNAELYRFTHRSVDQFFAFFIRETFVFDGDARYMFIHTGKGTEDEVEAEWNATGHRPDPIGDIYFSCGVLLDLMREVLYLRAALSLTRACSGGREASIVPLSVGAA